jgi:oxalate decarboxylase/phosphoglucose isomerase-like protein (cupin superfamily)
MHDETFYITQGTVRFHVPDTSAEGKDKKVVDAKVGDYMVVPIRAPHTFSNPGDEEARILFTSTPSFYINYFKLLSQLAKPDQPVPAEVNIQAMAMFATILADKKPRKPE